MAGGAFSRLLAFHLFVAAPVLDLKSGPSRATAIVVFAALLVALVSGIGWLWVVAGNIGDVTPVEAWRTGVVTTVLNQTHFGNAWRLRSIFWLIAAIASALMFLQKGSSVITAWICLSAAAAQLAGLAWAGHGLDGDGNAAIFHVIADATHLLVGGVWPFGLAPFAVALFRLQRKHSPLSRAGDLPFQSPGILAKGGLAASSALITSQTYWADAAALTRRFSAVALICVTLLTLSGLVNSWFMLPSVSSLWTSGYGRLLSLKIGIFVPMIIFAAVNRISLKPRLAKGSDPVATTASLRRNVIIEFLLGTLIILIVAVLGLLMPPMS
jgi:putative copper resistance protein D